MKQLIKSALSRIAPGLYLRLSSQRARRHGQRLEREWGYTELAHRVLERNGPAVSGGPFEGLIFPASTFDRHIAPKLFGSYEAALNPLWKEVLGRQYHQVLDIGCADGYFAVGLARALPDSTIHAFDTDPWARRTVREMAEVNQVANVRVHGACGPEWLDEHLRPGAFVLCDCEGYEDVLLDPDTAPALREADLLVELHEHAAPGVTSRLLDRFRETHDAVLVDDVQRAPDDYPTSSFLPGDDRMRALNEVRTDGQQWLYLTVRER